MPPAGVAFVADTAALARGLKDDVSTLETAYFIAKADTLAADLDDLATSDASPWVGIRQAAGKKLTRWTRKR